MANNKKTLTDEEFVARIKKYKSMVAKNKRRSYLGVGVNCWENKTDYFFGANSPWYIRDGSFASGLVRSFIGDDVFSRSDRWKMLRRARAFLARRSVNDSAGSVRARSVLDLFPALKHSYSSPLPGRVVSAKRGFSLDSRPVSFLDFCCDADGSSKKARFHDLSRSGSIRLDPVDSARQLFLYRRRIQRCISWGYSVGLVPLMMTVTIFHRWHPLRGLLNVLRDAWNYFFTASTAAVKRSRRMGIVSYVRRAEETITNGRNDDEGGGYNSGWHPHYHVILFVPADKVSVVASMEDELRDAWFRSVSRFFRKEFGEDIDPAYEVSFRKHGLFFSKSWYSGSGSSDLFYQETSDEQHSGHTQSSHEAVRGTSAIVSNGLDMSSNDTIVEKSKVNEMSTTATFRQKLTFTSKEAVRTGFTHPAARAHVKRFSDKACVLRHVDDSYYMAKVMGCASPSVYCGDNEMTSTQSKNSRVPFDLLLEDTAENNDLWVEYALATKGVRSFVFSHGFEARVNKYFEEHPEKDPIKPFVKSNKVVAQLDTRLYKIVEQSFKIDEMMRAAAKGYDVLCEWFWDFYVSQGVPISDISADMFPLPPGSRTPFGDVLDTAPSQSLPSTILAKMVNPKTTPTTPVSCSTDTLDGDAVSSCPQPQSQHPQTASASPAVSSSEADGQSFGLSFSAGLSYGDFVKAARERLLTLSAEDVIYCEHASFVIAYLENYAPGCESPDQPVTEALYREVCACLKAYAEWHVLRKQEIAAERERASHIDWSSRDHHLSSLSDSARAVAAKLPRRIDFDFTNHHVNKLIYFEFAGVWLMDFTFDLWHRKYEKYLNEFNSKSTEALSNGESVGEPETEEYFFRKGFARSAISYYSGELQYLTIPYEDLRDWYQLDSP